MPSIDAPSCYETSKCFFTYGQMRHLNPRQVPVKGNPWSSFGAQDFIHKVDLILPDECFELLDHRVLGKIVLPQFFRVTMTLAQVLHGDFLLDFIKLGKFRLLSPCQASP